MALFVLIRLTFVAIYTNEHSAHLLGAFSQLRERVMAVFHLAVFSFFALQSGSVTTIAEIDLL